RTVSGATVNLGSLSGSNAAATLQGAQNNANAVTYVVGANGQSTSFAGAIADGAYSTPGLTNLTKTGAGTLTLANGANTYTGVTTIRGGTLSVGTLANGGAASAIGDPASDAANLVIDGGTLQYTGGASTIDRAFTLTANGGAIERNGTGNFIFGSTADVAMPGSGDRTLTLTGTSTSFNNFNLGLSDPVTGRLSLVKNGAGTWRIGGNAKTYSGDTTVNAGSLYLIAGNVLPSGSGRGNVTVAGGATLDLYGSNQSINGLNGAGTVTTTLNTTRTLTVGNNDADGNFSGTLTQGANQTLALYKVGAGTQILGGTNTFTGTTTVSAGVLSVNGSINSSPVTVQGGTLGGNGSVLSIDESANGAVGPGNSIGTLSVIQNAALAGHLAVQLNGAGAGSADLLNVAGSLTLTGGTVDFSTILGGTTPDDPAYLFASYGTRVGTFAAVTGLPKGYAIDYAYNNGVSTNNIALVQSAVPEPAGLALLSLAAATGLRRRRRVA
ncbi:MAG: beta strand repeat-containing protein, partial [Tepidisphaeraceae bacterium]